MNNRMKEIAYVSAKSLVAKREKIIKAAIDYKVGDSDWDVMDILGRGGIDTYPNKTQQLYLDGEALVVFYPVEQFISGSQDSSKKITFSQKYKELYLDKKGVVSEEATP